MAVSKFPKILTLLAATSALTLFFWLIFYFNLPHYLGFPEVSLETIFANYDGPNYMVISKCAYYKDCIATKFSLPQPLEYYPAHFPGYPFLIQCLSLLTTTPKAMLLTTLLGSFLLTIVSFEFFKIKLSSPKAFWLALFFLIFPARLLVLRLVGAPETWFIGLILASILFFKNKKYFWAGVSASLSLFFKSPAVLLILSYLILAIYELIKTKDFIFIFKKYYSFLLSPLVLFLIFYLYKLQTGDFLAYFHSGDNFHLYFLPYPVFVSNRSWINTIWLEDVIYIMLFTLIGVYRLLKKYPWDIISIFPLVFTLATMFVGHRDISRYLAPVYPFLLFSYSKIINHRSFRLAFLIILPAIILYAVNFIIGNTAPISDWTPYL